MSDEKTCSEKITCTKASLGVSAATVLGAIQGVTSAACCVKDFSSTALLIGGGVGASIYCATSTISVLLCKFGNPCANTSPTNISENQKAEQTNLTDETKDSIGTMANHYQSL